MGANWQNRTIALLMACVATIGLAGPTPSFGDDADFAPSFLQFKSWYRWLEACQPDVFAVIQPQLDALVKATPPDSRSEPERLQFTKQYLRRSGMLDLMRSTFGWEVIRIRSTGHSWGFFLRDEAKQCQKEEKERRRLIDLEKKMAADRREQIKREDQERHRQIALEKVEAKRQREQDRREAAARREQARRDAVARRERIQRGMAAQADREKEAAEKAAYCEDHAQFKRGLASGPDIYIPRFTMSGIRHWQEWMHLNYPIRFAKYDERMGGFVECELEAYEAQGKEMDSILELMSNAGAFAFIVQTREWDHYVESLDAQR